MRLFIIYFIDRKTTMRNILSTEQKEIHTNTTPYIVDQPDLIYIPHKHNFFIKHV